MSDQPSNFCPAAKTTNAAHCWHAECAKTVDPPIIVERCCHCGERREYQQFITGHGRFAP